MVGGGNSAVTEALHLHHIGVDVTLVHREDRLRAQDSLAKNLSANNIPEIYSAGDVEGGYKQIVTAAGQGAEAAIAIFEDLMNPYWVRKKEK